MVAVEFPSLLFIGHVSVDRVRNLWGERTQLGGAALYSSLGARILSDNVRIISAVGKDFRQVDFLHSSFPGSIIKRVSMPTTFFEIIYDAKFKATYNEVKLGAGAAIKVGDLPPHWVRKGVYIHLAPMRPPKTAMFVKRIRELSGEAWVSVSSSPDYMVKSENRRILRSLAETVDLTVVNDREATALAETDSLISAIHTLKARRLAVTLGQLGAIIVENGRMQMIPALSGLTMTPKDTTGAGDTWCGTLLATYAKTQDWTKSVITASLVSAVKCLGWGFEKIKKLRLKSPDEVVNYVLRLSEGTGQLTLKEFLE